MKTIEPLDVMRYYVAYRDIEKQILSDIDVQSDALRLKAFKKYANSYMKIGRNFKKGADPHQILWTTKNYYREGKSDAEELSKIYLSNGLLNSRINNAVVAASKLLWLFNHGIIIMDNYNITILGAKDYKSYVIKWQESFKIKEPEIAEVISQYFKSIDPVLDEEWFRMRVFDQYLWSQYVSRSASLSGK